MVGLDRDQCRVRVDVLAWPVEGDAPGLPAVGSGADVVEVVGEAVDALEHDVAIGDLGDLERTGPWLVSRRTPPVIEVRFGATIGWPMFSQGRL